MFSQATLDSLTGQAALWLPRVVTGVVVFLLFWLAAVILRRVVIRVGEVRGIDNYLARFLGRAVRVGLLVFGAVTALGTAGVDVAALVAGLGLTGFALGFAFKDIISNVLSGILIIVYKPFDYDDHIKVSSFEGTVTSIDLRYTQLEADGRKIFVPNSMLFTNAITVGKGNS